MTQKRLTDIQTKAITFKKKIIIINKKTRPTS